MDDTNRTSKEWQWQLFTEEDENKPSYLNPQDTCYFLDYHYSYSVKPNHDMSNQIGNFKKGIARKGKNEWYYREKAVQLFAKHLTKFPAIKNMEPNTAILAMPSSKKPEHLEYDNRFEDLFNSMVEQQATTINIVTPITLKESVTAVHVEGKREPQALLVNYSWQGEDLSSINHLIVCDDVITSGAHFRAISNFLRQNGYNNKITGLFFARHAYVDHSDGLNYFEVLDTKE